MVSRSTNSFQSETRGATATPNFMGGSGNGSGGRMAGGRQRPGVDVPPRRLVVGADEVSAARVAIDARVVDAGRPFALVVQGAGGEQEAAARAGDHLVRGREVLEAEIGDRAHALGDRLVLQSAAIDAAVDP